MVSLVIVSHSRALADALVGLVRQVSQQAVPIAVAAGVGQDRAEFGTDAVEIAEAIQSVASDDGVLVLMDLGSAVMSAEMALELLPDDIRQKVGFCAAPLVEGAIAAAVQAGLGSDMAAVCQEAQQALQMKTEHFGGGEQAPTAPQPQEALASEDEITLTLHNQHGLHARPAARFVQTAASFQADIRVWNPARGKGPVSAKSLNGLATLGAMQGDTIRVAASGREAGPALQALERLVAENFGEQAAPAAPEADAETARTEAPPAGAIPPQMIQPGAVIPANPVSEGFALGPFYRYQPPLPPVPTEKAADPAQEWGRLERALKATQQSISARRQQLTAVLGEADAAIFDAHLLILQDPDLLDEVRGRINTSQENAAAAWRDSIEKLAQTYQALNDPYMRQRSADVLDVGRQVAFALAGGPAETRLDFPEPVVLFAQDLTPTETAQLEMDRVLALVTVSGGPTSHSAILARALGIPAVSGASPALETLPQGTLIGVDGSAGRLWVQPDSPIQSELASRRADWLARRESLLQAGRQPAATRDGARIEVAANVGSLADARSADENGAEGIGLLRTEFLYLTRTSPPTEAEQVDSLRAIAAVMGQRPVVVRTLDVGGDKALPYIQMAPEANPFLGVRALRLSLRNTGLFLTQLRAILRAGYGYNFRVMFPMVATLEEAQQARGWLEQAHQSLEADQVPHAWPIQAGIMVEIPSAAVMSRLLAPYVDFFSIGTNDLTQYTLAAERGNPSLASLQDAFNPAVLSLIGQVCAAASEHGRWVGVCGELAGDPLAAPVLVGLGVRELSMNAVGIPRVKEALRRIDLPDAQRLAQAVLQAGSAGDARQAARPFLEQV